MRDIDEKIVIEVTQRCPNECLHCSSESSPKAVSQLSKNEIEGLIDQARLLGVRKVVLSGGEPLVHPDIRDIVTSTRAHGLEVVIYTSGSVIAGAAERSGDARERLRELKNAGVSGFYLSVHSHDRLRHDRFMGRNGAWDQAVAFLGLTRELECDVDVHAVITRVNATDISELAEFALDHGARRLRLLRLVPQGRAVQYKKILIPTKGDWTSIKRQLDRLRKNNKPAFDLVWLGAHLDPILGDRTYTCSLDKNKLLVEPSGSISVCPALKGARSQLNAPNVRSGRLADVLDSEWRKRISRLKEEIVERECPAQTVYRYPQAEESASATGDHPWRLCDSALIDGMDAEIGRLGLPRDCVGVIRGAFEAMKRLPEYGSTFSLFKYSATVRETGGLPSLNTVWRAALQGAIMVLKEHDLRENPTSMNPDRRDTPVSLPDIRDLAEYYSAAEAFESVIYGVDPWYRDHFAHVIRVWLLAMNVALKQPSGALLAPALTNNDAANATVTSHEEVLAALTIATLTHDLGYPLQKVGQINRVLSTILQSTGGMEFEPAEARFSLARHEISQQLLHFLSATPEFRRHTGIVPAQDVPGLVTSWVRRCQLATDTDYLDKIHQEDQWWISLRSQWKYHQKYADSLEKRDHGLLSALLLVRKLAYFKEGEFALESSHRFTPEEGRQFTIRREILRALATHTCSQVYMLNSLSVEALLFFADEIQEWGRPMFSDLYGAKPQPEELTVDLERFDKEAVRWRVTVAKLGVGSAVQWLLSTGRRLGQRMRSGPETSKRSFSVRWTLLCGQPSFSAILQYGGAEASTSSSLVLRVGNRHEVDLERYMESLDGGAAFETVASELRAQFAGNDNR